MLKQQTLANICKNFVLLTIFTACFSQQSWSLQCERKTQGSSQFISHAYFEKSFPKTKVFSPKQFKPVGAGSKSIIAVETKNFQDGGLIYYNWRLLPSGKMIAFIKHSRQNSYSEPTNIHYKCNMKPDEVLASQPKPEKPLSKKTEECRSGNLKACDQNDLCERATTTKWSAANRKRLKVWETGKEWQNYVAEAKQRGLKCEVEEEFEKNNTNNSSSGKNMSLSTAKAECTNLGFSAGTEKHGDCVMKLLDY